MNRRNSCGPRNITIDLLAVLNQIPLKVGASGRTLRTNLERIELSKSKALINNKINKFKFKPLNSSLLVCINEEMKPGFEYT